MESYKCPKCGLACWKTAIACKRCQAPNPYLGHPNLNLNPGQIIIAASETGLPHLKAASDYVSLQKSHAPSSFAHAAVNNPNNVSGQNLGQSVFNAISSSLRAVIPDQANLTELDAAKRDLRWAWKAGRVGVSLTFGFWLQVCFEQVQYFGYQFGYLIFSLILMAPLVGINIGLIYGIYRKSRVCAVTLFCLAFLTVLSGLISCLLTRNAKDLGAVFLTVLFCYFYWLGVRGTFKYHHLAKP